MDSKYLDVARRIARVLISPDPSMGLMHGAVSVPKDLGCLVYGYLDTDSRSIHRLDRMRMMEAIKSGILRNENFVNMIENIFNVFNQFVPQEKQDEIYSRVIFSVSGRLALNSLMSKRIAEAIAQRTGLLVSMGGTTIGGVLLAGGMAHRSIYASRRLSKYAPEVYYILRAHNHDLLYFFVESAVRPFVDAIYIRRTEGQSVFNKIVDEVDNELKTKSR